MFLRDLQRHQEVLGMDDSEKTTLRDVLSKYLPENSNFYERITRAYDVLRQVRKQSDGHGITLVLRRDEKPSLLEEYMRHGKPYNGILHNLYDDDIARVMAEKRGKDFATVVDSISDIVVANVPLPVNTAEYAKKYGINVPIWEFLGYTPQEEAPGGRTNSALYATDVIGEDIFILTLGENKHGGKKGSINAFYCGDRIYSSSGRKVRWDLADPDKTDKRSNVVDMNSRKNDHFPCENYQMTANA